MSKSDRERASRLRKARRDGRDLSDRDSRWLARYEADRPPPRAAREREPARDASTELPAPPEELVELGPAPVASPAPAQTPPGNGNAGPGNVGLQAHPGPLPHGATLPGATPHALSGPCPVGPGCPGCAGRLSTGPQVCATTGREVYPEISDVAARGFAGIALTVIGWGVRLYARWVLGREVGACDPKPLEIAELADALKSAFRLRPSVGWIGSTFGDLAAIANVVTTYGARSLATKPEPATLPDAVPA